MFLFGIETDPPAPHLVIFWKESKFSYDCLFMQALAIALFDISISIVDISTLLKNIDIDIDMVIFENIDIDKAILENIDIKIDIDKAILKNGLWEISILISIRGS